MDDARKALESLKTDLESDERRTSLRFDEFLEIARKNPQRTFRNIFQLFHDMIKSYVGELYTRTIMEETL